MIENRALSLILGLWISVSVNAQPGALSEPAVGAQETPESTAQATAEPVSPEAADSDASGGPAAVPGETGSDEAVAAPIEEEAPEARKAWMADLSDAWDGFSDDAGDTLSSWRLSIAEYWEDWTDGDEEDEVAGADEDEAGKSVVNRVGDTMDGWWVSIVGYWEDWTDSDEGEDATAQARGRESDCEKE